MGGMEPTAAPVVDKPKMVHIRLEPHIHAALTALASKRERSLAYVIGKALESYVNGAGR